MKYCQILLLYITSPCCNRYFRCAEISSDAFRAFVLDTHTMYSVLQKRAGSEMHLPNLHPENDSDAPPAPEYCIDASSIGNFARFINHSCQPNLFVQCVLSSHNDVKLAKVTLFAADTILPLQVRSV